jgi:Fe-S-cluster containining protein
MIGDLDFSEFFKKYEKLASGCAELFESLKNKYPEEITCKIGCVDCCYALFDLSLIEAMYINRKFYEIVPQNIRKQVLERADRIDRQIYKIKRWAFKERQKGVPEDKILEEVGKKRVRCPLLSDDNRCLMYEFRPITCRLYGLPLVIGDEVKICPKTGFVLGKKYESIFMEKINQKLFNLSTELVRSIPTKHTALNEVLVPLSMALLTDYNEEYLGIIQCVDKPGPKGPSWVLGG